MRARGSWRAILAAAGGLALLAPAARAQVGTISTLAGGGPNNVPRLVANLPVTGIAQDSNGNYYLAGIGQVFKIDSTGTVTVFAGNGQSGFSGDGGPATQATLNSSTFVAVDVNNNVYIADSGDNLIRKVDATTHNISTVAGNFAGTICAAATDSIGDGCPATTAILAVPLGISVDSAGNLFIPDTENCVVRKVSAATGIIETVAGTPGVSGTGAGTGPATSVPLPLVFNICLDSADNIYILDLYTSQILEVVAATGDIQVFAGSESRGYNGDGIPATAAELDDPQGVFADAAGNIFIADTGNGRIREVGGSSSAMPGYIQTVAGNGTAGFSGDGGPATAAEIVPDTMMVDASGNMFIVDLYYRIREVYCADASIPCTPAAGTTAGEIQTFAGDGSCCSGGDGYPATGAAVGEPISAVADAHGNYYLADMEDDVIRKVDGTTGIISTIAGMAGLGGAPSCGYTGDGGLATNAQICNPTGLFVDGAGNVYITDTAYAVVREISAATRDIQTVAGGGVPCATATDALGDGCPATSAVLSEPNGVFVDGSGNILIADTLDQVIREVFASTGIIQTIAGTPQMGGFGGDGGLATAAGALLSLPYAVYQDSSGNLYIADAGNAVIREVQGPSGLSPGTLQTIVGQPGVFGYSGDGMLATMATTSGPVDVKVDAAGDIFFSDCGVDLEEELCNDVVREVSSVTGVIQTVAGNGVFGYNGDGEPATSAELYNLAGIGLDPFGNLLIADYNNDRVRSVAAIASNTATGMNLTVTPVDSTTGTTPVTVTFSSLTSAGVTSLTSGSSGPSAPTSFQLGSPPVYYNLSTTATYSGTITVCINYTGISFPSGTPTLWHYGASGWVNITTSVNTTTMVVCGTTTSLSPFALFQRQAVSGPGASLSASSLTFPPQVVGTRSTAQTVTLTNTGNATLTILSITTGGAFSQTNTCGTTLNAGANCTVAVTFKPRAAGTTTSALVISDNAAGSPQTVALSGTGLVFTVGPHPPVLSPPPTVPEPVQTVSPGGSGLPIAVGPRQPMVSPSPLVNPHPRSTTTSIAPVARLSSSTLVFSAQVVGTSSRAQTVTLTNPGDAPVPISSITTSGDFLQTNTCAGRVASGGSCTITVAFKPTATGARSGTLTLIDDSNGLAGTKQTVTLSGTGEPVVGRAGPTDSPL